MFDYLVATHILVAVTHVTEKGHQYFCFDFAANFSSRYQHWYKTILPSCLDMSLGTNESTL